MTLQRKPRIGETLIYNDGLPGYPQPDREFIVIRFDGNLMYYTENSEPSGPIIWQFQDGLNQCLSHRETAA